jgi:hypothetical protein
LRVKVLIKDRSSFTPSILVVDKKSLKVREVRGRFEMTRKWRGMARVKTIVYECVLEDDRRFVTKLYMSNMRWEVKRVG